MAVEAALSLDRRLTGLERQLGALQGQNLAQNLDAVRWRSEQVSWPALTSSAGTSSMCRR